MIVRGVLLSALCLSVSAEVIRINCGGPEIHSIAAAWRKDTSKYRSVDASQYESPTAISGSIPWRAVFRSHAYSSTGDLVYQVPVPSGDYNVQLLFAEVYFTIAGARQFSVSVDGRLIFANLDVFSRAGGAFKPLVVQVGVRGPERFLNVTVGRIHGKGNPMLSGLVIYGVNAAARVGHEGIAPASAHSPSPSPSPLRFCATGRRENEFSMNVNGGRTINGEFGAENTQYIVGSLGRTDFPHNAGIIPDGYRYATGPA